MLRWSPSNFQVVLKRDFKTIFNPIIQKSVTKKSCNWYFDRQKHLAGIYLAGREKRCAMMLSGGIDSSLVQAAINANLDQDKNFSSFSYVIQSPGFKYEVDYAKEASAALNTNQTFFELTPQQYIEGIIQSIEILGEPPPDDVRFCFYMLSDYISMNFPEIKHLFHGAYTDGFNGGSAASMAVQGDRYKTWPIPLLELLGTIISPFSQSKSYGAKIVAVVIGNTKDIRSKDYYLNSVDLYSNWEMVEKCFSTHSIDKALESKRIIVDEYLDSQYLVENLSTLDTLISGLIQHTMERTLGYIRNLEFVYPYGDESIIEASGSFLLLKGMDLIIVQNQY